MSIQPKKIDDHEKRLSALEDAIQDIRMLAQAVERHEKILKGGDSDSEKGILERMRIIEASITGAAGWVKTIALIFIGQFVTVIFGVLIFFVKALPALLQLVNK